MHRIRWEDIEGDVNAFLDKNAGLEMSLFVAWKCGRLLDYLEGDEFDLVDTIDKRRDFLFVLFRRPLFDDTERLALMLGGGSQ